MVKKTPFQQKIQIELVKLLFQQLKFALWGELFAVIGLFVVLRGAVDQYLLIGWFTYMLLVSGLGRHLLTFFYKHSHFYSGLSQDKPFFWLMLFMAGVFLSGLGWGYVGSVLMVKHNIMHQTFTLFLLIGAVAVANPLYSPIRSVYAAFLLPAFIPFALWLILQGGIFVILGCLAFIFIIIMLATSFYSHRLISTSLQLRFENTDLVDDLSQAKTVLEDHTQELEKSFSLVRATLESSTDGMLVVDTDNNIEECNKKFIEMWKIPLWILEARDIKAIITIVRDQLVHPNIFAERMAELAINPEAETFDELIFKDGRVFERYSHPRHIGNHYAGRVWTFRDVTGRKLLEAKLFHQANFDSLTGLPNRVLVMDRISQAIVHAKREKSHLAVLFLDLDRFKMINDTLGHSLGDKLLKVVAARLIKCVRENDTVSREGGDEFLMILTSLKNEADTVTIARKCLESLGEPFLIEGNKFNSTISVGISFYPRDGQDAETLIRNADIAMYRAKELGRNNFQFFTEQMNKKVQTRLLIENSLRSAVERKEFSIVYQPIVSLKSKQVVGMEALLRWHHATMGWVSPSEFVPVAEENGMIIPMADWVLRVACAQAKNWQREGLAPIQVYVNVSARQFKQANFFEQLIQILNEEQLEPHYLALELTENILMYDVQKNIKMLNKIKKLGVSIVIDDFGVGYSSLSQLKCLPVDKLKINGSFIQDIPNYADDAAITSAIIALAGKLNIKVIAEDVENQSQLHYLLKHNCDEIQGFYFSEPLDAEKGQSFCGKIRRCKWNRCLMVRWRNNVILLTVI